MAENADDGAAGPRWVVIGCGYTGTHLTRRLVGAGAEVVVTRRDAAAAERSRAATGAARACAVDLADAASLDGVIARDDVVVCTAAPSPGSTAGEEALVGAAADAGARRLVYVSSTGVYPPAAGARVTEDVAPAPASSRGQARLAAETAILEGAAARGLEAVSLRAAGIYGPGRGVVARLAAGTYRIIGDGDRVVCRIHIGDLVTAIVAAGTIELLPSRIYNVADDEPAPSAVYAEAAAAALGVESPPRVGLDEVPQNVRAMLGANRRIDNRRLTAELGVVLRYPSWRDSLDELVEDARRE